MQCRGPRWYHWINAAAVLFCGGLLCVWALPGTGAWLQALASKTQGFGQVSLASEASAVLEAWVWASLSAAITCAIVLPIAVVIGVYCYLLKPRWRVLAYALMMALFVWNAVFAFDYSGETQSRLQGWVSFGVGTTLFASLLFLIWMETLGHTLFLMASLDGASFLQQIQYLVLPLSRYAIAYVGLSIVGQFFVFYWGQARLSLGLDVLILLAALLLCLPLRPASLRESEPYRGL